MIYILLKHHAFFTSYIKSTRELRAAFSAIDQKQLTAKTLNYWCPHCVSPPLPVVPMLDHSYAIAIFGAACWNQEKKQYKKKKKKRKKEKLTRMPWLACENNIALGKCGLHTSLKLKLRLQPVPQTQEFEVAEHLEVFFRRTSARARNACLKPRSEG